MVDEARTLDIAFKEEHLKHKLGELIVKIWQLERQIEVQHNYLEELERRLRDAGL